MTFTTRTTLVRSALFLCCAISSTSAFAFSQNGVSIGMSRQEYESKHPTESCRVLETGAGDVHCFYVASPLLDPIPKGLDLYHGVPIDILSISFRKDSICDISLKVEGKYGDLFIKALTKELGEPQLTTFPRFKSLDWSKAEYVAGLTVIASQGFVHFSVHGRKCLLAEK
jgi:hypothetical protein